jgi:hypothetical protein
MSSNLSTAKKKKKKKKRDEERYTMLTVILRNSRHMCLRSPVLISDPGEFIVRKIIIDKEGHYMMIKGSTVSKLNPPIYNRNSIPRLSRI